jgi:hypothetical protein
MHSRLLIWAQRSSTFPPSCSVLSDVDEMWRCDAMLSRHTPPQRDEIKARQVVSSAEKKIPASLCFRPHSRRPPALRVQCGRE